jgi:hypothetical protein
MDMGRVEDPWPLLLLLSPQCHRKYLSAGRRQGPSQPLSMLGRAHDAGRSHRMLNQPHCSEFFSVVHLRFSRIFLKCEEAGGLSGSRRGLLKVNGPF